MLLAADQELSELQRRLDRDRDLDLPITLNPSELGQPLFCMRELFGIIPGCNCEPIQIEEYLR